jgi:hypothetical protein
VDFLCGFAADRCRESTNQGVGGVIDAGLNSVEAELDDSCSDEFDGKKIVFRGCESGDS